MRSLARCAVVFVVALAGCRAPPAEAAKGAPTSTKGQEPPGLPPAAVADDRKLTLTPGAPVGGFDRPVALVGAGDGSSRVFVVEQAGLIRVMTNGGAAKTWLDARALLGSSSGEQGLLGLAFHPKFKENGRFFIAYTDKDERDAVAELRVPTPTTPPTLSSLKVLFAIDDPAANHNGGHLLFGPDGKLWIGTGDGGGANDPWKNAQNPSSLLGKMLVVDVDAADAAAQRPVPWARGLRNPWRYAFDKRNGDLWIADVGQNQWEEVDVVTDAVKKRGLDFGWSQMEGRVCFRGPCDPKGTVVPPIVYSHDMGRGGGCSVTGGVVKDGVFVYGDYCSGEVWGARRETAGDGATVKTQSLWKSDRRVSSFGVDDDGGVWLVDHQGFVVPLTLAR